MNYDSIAAKTGPLEPGTILELNLLTIDELTHLKVHPSLSVNQRKKCDKRIKWLQVGWKYAASVFWRYLSF